MCYCWVLRVYVIKEFWCRVLLSLLFICYSVSFIIILVKYNDFIIYLVKLDNYFKMKYNIYV